MVNNFHPGFQPVCMILRIKNVFLSTYYSQTNGQVDWYYHIFIFRLHHYVEQHSQKRDLYMNIITFGYDIQLYRITSLTSYALELTQALKLAIVSPDSKESPAKIEGLYLYR